MKKFVTLLFITICSVSIAEAQTFLEHVQKKEPGKASVKINQSKDIDELVNGKAKPAPTQVNKTENKEQSSKADNKAQNNKTKDNKDSAIYNKVNTHPVTPTQLDKIASKTKEEEPHKHTTAPKPEEKRHQTEEAAEDELEIPTIDMRKKVMRKSYKISGYRVQAYAGGNSRADRQRAEGARDKIKQILPNEPVYVHFYSPRWICRVGNYRSYEEAARVLSQVKALGYKQASVVRGQITVQY